MKLITKPEVYSGDETSLFIAGGIRNCPNWQIDVIKGLTRTDLVLLNPRREDFVDERHIHDPDQIAWERQHLIKATAIMFWFPHETLCPSTLFELGYWLHSDKPLFVGIHLDYQRCFEVSVQTKLARPEIHVTYSLWDVIAQILRWEFDLVK